MSIDFFGKFEELESQQAEKHGILQISESSLYDRKSNRIYFTDELGRIGTLAFTNGGRIINDLVKHGQINIAHDILDLMIEMEFELGEN